MRATAWCVAYIEKETGQVVGASFFSEPSPTCSFSYHTFVLFETEGEDFEAALDRALEYLKHHQYDWLGPISMNGTRVGRYREKVRGLA